MWRASASSHIQKDFSNNEIVHCNHTIYNRLEPQEKFQFPWFCDGITICYKRQWRCERVTPSQDELSWSLTQDIPSISWAPKTDRITLSSQGWKFNCCNSAASPRWWFKKQSPDLVCGSPPRYAATGVCCACRLRCPRGHMRKAMEKSDGSSSLKGWLWESNVVIVGTCRVYAKKDIERQYPQRCTHTTMIFCQALPKCIPISKSPGVQAKVGGDHIETARSKRWGDFGSKEWRVKTALVHWNAVMSWTLVAIPTSNCTSQATNWNWLANRGTEVLGVLLSRRPWGFSQLRSVEKQWACAQRRIKRALNKKTTLQAAPFC